MLVDVACVEVACVDEALEGPGGQNSEGEPGGDIMGIGNMGSIGIIPPA
jgi:hypothetical protein